MSTMLKAFLFILKKCRQFALVEETASQNYFERNGKLITFLKS